MTFSGNYRHHFGLLTQLWKTTLTECNSGATQKLPLGVNNMTELKKYNKMSLLLDTVVIFLGCVTVAFSEQYTVLFTVTVAFSEQYTALITACCIYKKQRFSQWHVMLH